MTVKLFETAICYSGAGQLNPPALRYSLPVCSYFGGGRADRAIEP